MTVFKNVETMFLMNRGQKGQIFISSSINESYKYIHQYIIGVKKNCPFYPSKENEVQNVR